MARTRIPSLRLHRPSGLAVVTLNGRDHYLGPHDAPDVEQRYNALVARWVAGGRRPLAETDATHPDGTPALTVAGLAERFAAHCEATYRKRGEPTSYAVQVARIMGVLAGMYGSTPAARFGRREFTALRHWWTVTPGGKGKMLARSTVNNYAEVVRYAFRWAAERGDLPASVWSELMAVKRLGKGRTTAREPGPVRAPDPDAVRLVRDQVAPVVRAMIDVQSLTGMRPGEVCGMRVGDVDRSGPVWHYRVSADVNKMEHKGGSRVVSIGPRAQAVLSRWLDRAERLRGRDGFVFVSRAGNGYRVHMYADTVRRACEAVELPAARWWTPNGLRHLAATTIRSRYGIEAAQAVLGHGDVQTTQIYAEVDTSAADRVAAEMG